MDPRSHDRLTAHRPDAGPATECEHPLVEEAARLADVLAASWRRGVCCPAEEILAGHPAVQAYPQAALRVVHEEVCQRHELGQDVSLTELCRRFPRWRDQLTVLLDCINLLGMTPHAPRFPAVGETLGEFRVLAELGRGGRGRVYLAEQSFLAGRLMVLKVIPLGDQEHLKLARLQHTHIVPLYSVRDFPDRNLRKLCMPCLGGATLQQLLCAMDAVPPEKRTGRDLLGALQTGVANARLFWSAQGPNRRFLEEASYVQAVCWMGVCLADALHYAHGQGLVHLDVKPSNVLLTADCQPMLLDFHLAQGPLLPGGDPPDWLGGTQGYMSPEQQAALRACREQRPIPTAVDARSDLYSLGLLLREALYGELPEAEATRAAANLAPRPDVSPGLRDVLARCLAPDPDQRYQNAALLAADLRRHLTDRPLLGVRNRSLAERWRKWRRRRPQGLLLALFVIAGLAAAIAWGVMNVNDASARRHDAEAALHQGRSQAEQHHYAEAQATFDRALERLGSAATGTPLDAELRRQRQLTAQANAVAVLHEQVERGRYLYGDDTLPAATLHALEAQYRQAWEQRDHLLQAESLPQIEDTLRRDLLDLAVLWADCRLRLAAPTNRDDARAEVLSVLAEAESLFGPSPVLSRERRALDPAAVSGADEPPPRTAWEHYAVGRWLLRAGDLDAAAAAFDRATELRPQDFWPWYGKGVCAHRRGRADEAAAAFSVCVALAPDSAPCYYNRGLTLAARADAAAALRDYDRALQLDPRLAAAALNRGVLHYQQHHFGEAEADFHLALDLGANAAAVHYNRAVLHQARQEPAAALDCVEQALRLEPTHRPSRDLQALLHKQLLPAGSPPRP